MMIPKPKDFDKKPEKRYRLYCPVNFKQDSEKGFDTFHNEYFKAESNVIEHLERIGAMMTWFQIVDKRDGMKVVKQTFPI